MLFCTVVSDAFDRAPPVDGPCLARPMHRPATETLALYARALDDMRLAYAQVSADYAGALKTAAALRKTLLRADLHIRRIADDDACPTSSARVDALEARIAAQAATIRHLRRVAAETGRGAARRGRPERTTCVARS